MHRIGLSGISSIRRSTRQLIRQGQSLLLFLLLLKCWTDDKCPHKSETDSYTSVWLVANLLDNRLILK